MATTKTFIGNIRGPKGDTGAKGDTGSKGDKGDTGYRGSRWTEGTAITGTSTTETVFSGTGISDSLVNDHYLNTSTGNIYRCTVSGDASTAKWVFVGNLKGPKGDTGAKGDKGDTGETGPQGPQGEYATVDSVLSDTSTNPVQNKVVNEALSGKLDTDGDSKNNVVSFSSGDSTNPTGWADIAAVASGETHASLFRKFSLAVKNLRYLYKMLGTTDISAIGDGTVTGAISGLNNGLEDMLLPTKYEQIILHSDTTYNTDSFEVTLPKSGWVCGQNHLHLSSLGDNIITCNGIILFSEYTNSARENVIIRREISPVLCKKGSTIKFVGTMPQYCYLALYPIE